MRKEIFNSITLFLFLFSVTIIHAQVPNLTVDGKSNNGISLQKLQIEIKVCGTVAKTTWQMVFKNNTGKILEGMLNFPLKDGIAVSRYGIDINGKIREAVPVDRGKGTMVFEAIERRKVDPGLLEKIEGNIFRTRIYPVNAYSTRTVVIGYEEELPLTNNDKIRYYSPLNFQDTIADFLLAIEVIQSAVQPVFDTTLSLDLHFDKQNNLYKASLHKMDYVAQQSLSFSIPKPLDATEVMLQEFENKYYYLINTRLEKKEREKQLPKNIYLLWDASLSGSNRNIRLEKQLLDTYFKKVNTAGITLIVFSNKIYSNRKYQLKNGGWDKLYSSIDSIQYDGATNLGCLQLDKFSCDEFLLMSDGHQTFGSSNIQLNSKPVYCINSSASADYSNLNFIALKTGGSVIDLQKDDVPDALQKLAVVPFHFMGILKNKDVEENYPSLPVTVIDQFSAAGIAAEEVKEITLQFGYGGTVTLTKTITIDPGKQLCENFDISKIFAQKKIAELDIQYEENKQAIESIGKRFGIVTRNTSLIVLETLNDYLQYNVEPPAELRNEFDRIMKQRSREITLKNEKSLETSMEMIDELKTWWSTVKKPIVPVKKSFVSRQLNRPIRAARTLVSHPTGISKTVNGRIINAQNDSPVAGATIRIKGKFTGTQADVNGNFALQVRNGEVLQYAAVGFTPAETRVANGSTINVSLQQAVSNLEEVVVAGYATSRRREATGSIQSVSANSITSLPVSTVQTSLEGKVSGVQVTSSEGIARYANPIAIRGSTSFSNSVPLYIIDGRAGNLDDVSPNDIEKMDVLKDAGATSIYGAAAVNGVVIITTKNGTFKNKNILMADSIFPVGRIDGHQSAPAIEVSQDNGPSDYIKAIKATVKTVRYEKYLQLRKYHMANPVYFFEVAGYFLKTGDKETGLRILSNLAELETGSYELYKMLGYKLKQTGDYDGEIIAFQKVLEQRPLDPQSHRDLALALEDAGHYQEALDQLQEGMTKSFTDAMTGIYKGIEEIFLLEINRMIALHAQKLKLKEIPKKIIQPMPVDLRIVMNWNMNNTDIDLWVTGPDGEKCMYSNPATAAGGRMSDDFTEGFGPEQFILKNGQKGKYRVEINYFGDNQVTLSGPTTVMAEIYLHYGMQNEEKRIVTLQMEKDKSGAVFIGEITL